MTPASSSATRRAARRSEKELIVNSLYRGGSQTTSRYRRGSFKHIDTQRGFQHIERQQHRKNGEQHGDGNRQGGEYTPEQRTLAEFCADRGRIKRPRNSGDAKRKLAKIDAMARGQARLTSACSYRAFAPA
jgi:hypothetical protein